MSKQSSNTVGLVLLFVVILIALLFIPLLQKEKMSKRKTTILGLIAETNNMEVHFSLCYV